MTNINTLPADLPAPEDDGLCDHLLDMQLPNVALNSTRKQVIQFADIKGWLVIYCYPMTGQPDKPLPDGWNEIPGARGCTPQSCAFRDYFAELIQLEAQVFGLSTQSTEYQQEAAQRLHLPFALLSDADFAFTHALKLPTFTVDDLVLNKRVTLLAHNGVIKHVFYPVFPPDQNAQNVIDWLKQYG